MSVKLQEKETSHAGRHNWGQGDWGRAFHDFYVTHVLAHLQVKRIPSRDSPGRLLTQDPSHGEVPRPTHLRRGPPPAGRTPNTGVRLLMVTAPLV